MLQRVSSSFSLAATITTDPAILSYSASTSDAAFWHTFVSTDKALKRFIACLPPLYDKRGIDTLVPGAVRAFKGMNPFLVVIHTFAFTACVRLHGPLAQADSAASYDRSIEAIQGAMSVVDKIKSLDVGEHLSALASVSSLLPLSFCKMQGSNQIHGYFKVCWQSIFRFLITEYRRKTKQHEARAAEIRTDLKSIFSIIHKMAKYFPILCASLKFLWNF